MRTENTPVRFIITSRGQVIDISQRSLKLLRTVGIEVDEGMLRPEAPWVNELLIDLIEHASDRGYSRLVGCSKDHEGLVDLRWTKPRENLWICKSFRMTGGDSDALILIVVSRSDTRPPISELTLQLTFGLTSSEVALAIGIAEGVDLEELSKARGVKVATVRNQLKSVFSKTQTKRQTELTSLVWNFSVI